MSLTPCRECGRQISDSAKSCPQCGAPVAPAPSEQARPAVGAQVRPNGVRRSSIVLLGVVAVVAILCWNAVTRGALVPIPRYELLGSSADDGCSTLGDYCQRAHCVVRNVGNATGSASVAATMFGQGRPPTTKFETLALAPGEQREASIDFAEATLGSPFDRVLCTLR